MSVDAILEERGNRYGNYLKQTQISRRIREAMFASQAADALMSDQEDALIQIAVKISRIVNGDPSYADNWRDIAGYAQLVADRLDGKERL